MNREGTSEHSPEDAFNVHIEQNVFFAQDKLDHPCPIHGSWRDTVYRTFNAPMMPAPFAEPFPELVHDRPAIQVLHELTSNPTKGLVKKLLPSLPPKDTLLMLLNALHFAGKWPDGTIELNGTEESQTGDVPRLDPKRSRASYFTSETLKSSLIRLPFAAAAAVGSETSEPSAELIILRPIILNRENDSLRAGSWLRSFSWEQLLLELSGATEKTQTAQAAVPEFEAECHIDLKEALRALGLETLFDAESANLERLTSTQNVAIAEMSHKSKVVLHGDGLEAASAGVSLLPSAASSAEEMTQRKQFVKTSDAEMLPLYFVVACDGWITGEQRATTESMLPLFMGMLNSVNPPSAPATALTTATTLAATTTATVTAASSKPTGTPAARSNLTSAITTTAAAHSPTPPTIAKTTTTTATRATT